MAEATAAKNPQATQHSGRKRFADVVSEADDLTIRVYPLNYPVFLQHADELAAVLQSLADVDYTKLRETGVTPQAIWWALAPVAGRQVLRLVDECCVPRLSECQAPVDVTTEVVVRWFELSFFSGGFSRIAAAAESLLSVFGGQPAKDSENSKTSPDSSASASTAGTSSPAIATTATPAGDGRSPSSTSTSAPPTGS
jgi:hypothetical protein